MKIHFLKESCLETLRSNLHSNLKKYRNPSNDWVAEACGEEPFAEFRTEVTDFSLEYDSDKDSSSLDVRNAITLYTALKDISDAQATEERFWAGLCHSDFYEFLHRRWQMSFVEKLKDQDVLGRYFFGQGAKRSLFSNSLAKLWWVGRLSYNESLEDKFALTKYFSEDFSTKTLMIFSNNFMANKNIVTGLLSALIELDKEGFVMVSQKKKRDIYYEAARYLNVLGGTCILDFYSSEEIKDKVIKHIKNM
ncbi:MAG: hypothetical protein J5534_04240 [Fibrobacter sp.]|nr:hypothetical protein [Fibrobacter sp.]